MAKYQFTATHGVQFRDDDGVWAHFTRDAGRETGDGRKVYVFETDDAKVAQRVRSVKDYGITETSKAANSDE